MTNKAQRRADNEAILARAKEDFATFFALVIGMLYGFKITRLQTEMANFLQYDPSPRKAIFGFRGLSKTLMLQLFSVWMFWRQPTLLVKYWSATSGFADSGTQFVLKLIQNDLPFLRHLAPPADEPQNTKRFNVAGRKPGKDSSWQSQGIFSQLVGGRADIILVDDPETSSNADSLAKIQKIERQMMEIGSILLPDKAGITDHLEQPMVVFAGTFHTLDGIYPKLEGMGYKILVLPVDVPDSEQIELMAQYYPPKLLAEMRTLEEGTPLDRFSRADLERRRIDLVTQRNFDLQLRCFMLAGKDDSFPLDIADMPILAGATKECPRQVVWSDGEDTRLDTLQTYNCGHKGSWFHRPQAVDGPWGKYDEIIMTIDQAGEGRDETGWCVMGSRSGMLYIMSVGGFVDAIKGEQVELLVRKAYQHKATNIKIEANFGGTFLAELLQPTINKLHEQYPGTTKPGVTLEKAIKRKETRIIQELGQALGNHRLVMFQEALKEDYETADKYGDRGKMYRFIYQLTHLTSQKNCLPHDDRLDAVSAAAAHFQANLSADPTKKAHDEYESDWVHINDLKDPWARKRDKGLVIAHKLMRNSL